MSLSNIDIVQTQKYKQMLGLTNLVGTSNLSILTASATILGGLYISTYSNFYNNTTILSTLNISENVYFNQVTNNSNINIQGNFISNKININSNCTIINVNTNNNLNISNNTILTDVICKNNINISALTIINNNLYLSNLASLYNSSNTSLNIYAKNINLGNINSTVNMIGTTTYFATNEVRVLDKIIALNLNSSLPSTVNNGEYCGIQIYSSSGIGFIRTNNNATRYEIKAPLDNTIRYISTVDYNNNLSISGNTNLYGASTIFSMLNVNGDTVFVGNSIFNSSLITSGNTILQNAVTSLSNINILGNAIIYKNITIRSSFYVNGKAQLNGNTTLNSNLTINGNTVILGATTLLSRLNIFGNSLLQGSTSLNNNLYISGRSIINGVTTIRSSLNINGLSNISGSISVNNTLLVSNITVLQGSSNLNSSINVNGNVIINGNMTIGSILNYNTNNYNNLSILGQMISKLPNYLNNTDAVNNGVPLWGFYRTGGVLKIRLDDRPPILTLLGYSTMSINYTTVFVDPGIISTDINNKSIIPYLISISNTSTSNIISNNIQISGLNTLISDTSRLEIGNYTLTYQATDSIGNTAYITRNLNIINNIMISTYTNNNIVQTYDSSGNAYNIVNGNLIGGVNCAWAFSNNFINIISFNSSWSVILKAQTNSWNNILQINFDPLFTNWSLGNFSGNNCGVSNVNFKDSALYFSNDSYWNSSLPPVNFYPNFNSTDGIYIKISRDNNTQLLTISFYDKLSNLIDSRSSIFPFIYNNFNSLFSFTSYININWLKGFLIHNIDTYASIQEFDNYFN